ncbi:MAG: Guanylate kinase [Firmicutes bacterium ADurb.Bin300]|jgi:guanylate kinase|nr:MAG: Guanylate kinase [Firmicutes bacterium ADurb.Bin300]
MDDCLNKCGLLIVLSGPSGVGKDTVLKKLREKLPGMCLSVSMTTRSMRQGEVDGVNYIFTDFGDFEKKIGQGFFLEYAKYGTNYYGTPKATIESWLARGKVVFLKIEVQGAEKVRSEFAESVSVFLTTPTFADLICRLKARKSECEEDILRRVNIAKSEITRANEYDYIVINDEVERAAEDICAIVRAERLKYKNMKKYVDEVINNA